MGVFKDMMRAGKAENVFIKKQWRILSIIVLIILAIYFFLILYKFN